MSRLMNHLATGAAVCVTVTLTDGLVYSRTALYHSVNYRSIVCFGRAGETPDVKRQRELLEAMIARYFPGRTAGRDYEPAPEAHMEATAFVALEIEEWSAKIRRGGPQGSAGRGPALAGHGGSDPAEPALGSGGALLDRRGRDPVLGLEQQAPLRIVRMDFGDGPVVAEDRPALVRPAKDPALEIGDVRCSPASPASSPPSRRGNRPSCRPRSPCPWRTRAAAAAAACRARSGARRPGGSPRTPPRVRASSTTGEGPAGILSPACQLRPVDPLTNGSLRTVIRRTASNAMRPSSEDRDRGAEEKGHQEHQQEHQSHRREPSGPRARLHRPLVIPLDRLRRPLPGRAHAPSGSSGKGSLPT